MLMQHNFQLIINTPLMIVWKRPNSPGNPANLVYFNIKFLSNQIHLSRPYSIEFIFI